MPIELRHRTYFAYLDVPADVRKRARRRVFRQTLQTDSRAVALRRAAPLVAQWKAEIARLREEPNHNDSKFWRDALRRTKTPEDRARVLEQIDAVAWDIGASNVDQIGDRPSTNPEAIQFFAAATGAISATDEYLDEWIGSLQVKGKTAAMRRATIARLTVKFPNIQDITRKEVRRWVPELLQSIAPATVKRLMSDCRTYWAYLEAIEAAPEDSAPFDRLGLKVKSASWLPYSPKEVALLLSTAAPDPQLCDLVRLAMYSGARREELCSLKVENILRDRFEIIDAKTEAGIRIVPIHSELSTTIKRLTKKSKDGFLISGLVPNKNGDRGDILGKRFTRLKRSLNFGPRHTFHSFRGTVITLLERAGVPESTVQDIVGHERSTLTGSTYSGKSTLEMRKHAIEKLTYPAITQK